METSREPCPRCRAIGKDTSGDNLVRWHDGHAHCFACQHHEFPNGHPYMDEHEKCFPAVVELPQDAHKEIDFRALTWLAGYEIEMDEVIKYRMLWSQSQQMLLFPIYATDYENDAGKLLGWQGKNFNPNYELKYYKVGPFQDILHVMNLTDGKGGDIIIMEDYLSAIKVGRRYTTLPLFGCELSLKQMKKLNNYAEDLTFWLDEDKADRAMELAKRATQLGFRTKYIITKHDPKEHTDEQIRETIETHS